MDDTSGVWLKNCKKVVYIGTRRFLRPDYPFRRNKKSFNEKIETRPPPVFHDGKQVFAMVKDIRIVFWKGLGSTSVPKCDNKAPMWKKRSVLWTLPYRKNLQIRHVIDVMHVEKNVCDSLIGILLDIRGKTKDTLETRKDLQAMKLRNELHPIVLDKG